MKLIDLDTDSNPIAVALGASIIEVNFTDNKSGRAFRNHEPSFEPEEFLALNNALEGEKASVGNYGKVPANFSIPFRRNN